MAVEVPSIRDLEREIRTQAKEGYTQAVIVRRLIETRGLTEEVAAAMVSRVFKTPFDPAQQVRKAAAVTGVLLMIPGLVLGGLGIFMSSQSDVWFAPLLIGLALMGVGAFRLSWALRMWGN